MKSDEELLAELKDATAGLLFMSESDYPFETFSWEGITEVSPQFLRGLTGHTEDAPVEVVSADYFFRVATSEEARRSEEGRRMAKRYSELLETLKRNLEDLKVYRVGEINIPVYIVGRNRTGNWLGLSTRVVET